MNIDRLATLARKMMLTPAQAVVLPAVIDRTAEVGGITTADMIERCFAQSELCHYLASICRKVALTR